MSITVPGPALDRTFGSGGMEPYATALLASPSQLALVPLFLLALLIVRGVPALLGLRESGPRTTLAVALLQATSLPFLVTAAQIGMELGQLSTVTGAALVCAGLLSVLLFPPTALSLLRERTAAERPPTPRAREATPTQHGQS
jgi:hypothetical protein